MVYGKTEREQIQMNEDSIWYGEPINRNNPDALKNLPIIRKYEGDKLTFRTKAGRDYVLNV